MGPTAKTASDSTLLESVAGSLSSELQTNASTTTTLGGCCNVKTVFFCFQLTCWFLFLSAFLLAIDAFSTLILVESSIVLQATGGRQRRVFF